MAAAARARASTARRARDRGAAGPPDAPEPAPARHWLAPAPGLAVLPGLTLHHDARGGEFAARTGPDWLLRLTVYQFDGSYLSLARALSGEVRAGLRPGRALEATLDIEASRPLTVFLRLNLQTPTAAEQLHETLVVHRGARTARFDLDAARLAPEALGAAWLDVIFSEPAMAEIVVRALPVAVAGHG